MGEGRQLEATGQFHQDFLERLALALRGTTGMRTESTGPSNSEIGRSSIDMQSWRSR